MNTSVHGHLPGLNSEKCHVRILALSFSALMIFFSCCIKFQASGEDPLPPVTHHNKEPVISYVTASDRSTIIILKLTGMELVQLYYAPLERGTT